MSYFFYFYFFTFYPFIVILNVVKPLQFPVSSLDLCQSIHKQSFPQQPLYSILYIKQGNINKNVGFFLNIRSLAFYHETTKCKFLFLENFPVAENCNKSLRLETPSKNSKEISPYRHLHTNGVYTFFWCQKKKTNFFFYPFIVTL